jgi:galactokinase
MKSLNELFQKHFGREPLYVVQAPGRVNLIGEHTDYNEGFVLPIAIDKRVVIAVAPRRDRKVVLYSCNYDSWNEFSLESIAKDHLRPWSNYPRGVAYLLQKLGHRFRGLDALITSDLPMGAGLSSSAAFELASAWALLVAGRKGDAVVVNQSGPVSSPEMPGPLDLIRLCREVENDFVGVKCGIMDQFISALGRRQHALFLDCRTLTYQQVPLPDSVKIVVCNTGVKRELASSEYNKRRYECDQGVHFFKGRIENVSALRDVHSSDLERFFAQMDPLIRKRCRHVISENERVLESVEALRAGDLERFGQLMTTSHESLKRDYEVSSKELNVMVEIALQQAGVLGSRMTGAGFGGCTVNLVRNDSVNLFVRQVQERYQLEIGIAAEIYVCNTSDGAGIAPPESSDNCCGAV